MDKKELTYKFEIQEIQTIEFATLTKSIDPDKIIRLDSNLQFGIYPEVKGIVCEITIELYEEEKMILKLVTNCNFIVKNNSWEKLKTEENKISLPKGFLSHLATISMGTTRGILHTKTENTIFNHFTLPLINVKEMIQEDQPFEIE
jgi:hypothetical protein